MSEMADMFLESVLCMEEMRLDYKTGHMSDVEAYDAGIIDENGSYVGPNYGRSRFKTCRCCNQSGLHWENRDGRWRLCDERGVHQCSVCPLRR